ncbi:MULTISPECIES: hypothetical protein [Prosthecochloris]|uniref:Tetratricopeptide repeat protein n=1 Tax=Prosthecochloris vibrioformis TaxID=1098 RepID=A0A5C4S2X4_PROVB|nr:MULTISPECIES: hypothetical protein [Prosthecochloris]ANT65794.1 hypothetical protein Ptc2401_02064 [Prosthecochloris sp. CIB 2401]TNJ37836.1 hypothetical protein FGF68_01265 [Prosthecochloris vibrioformis]
MKTVTWCKGILFLFATVALAGCQDPVSGPGTPGDLLEKARNLVDEGEAAAALELLEKGIGADTLNGYSRFSADMLMLKRRIEERNGEYFNALDTHRILAEHCLGMLDEGSLIELGMAKARLLADMGRFSEAAETGDAVAGASARDRLQVAEWYLQAGLGGKAVRICSEFDATSDLPLRLEAAALALRAGGQAHQAVKVLELSRQLVSRSGGDPLHEAYAFRRAAQSLVSREPNRDDASYLLFKALSRARAAGAEQLEKVLDYEANAVLERNSEVSARSATYFEDQGMELPGALAFLDYARFSQVADGRRYELLRQGIRRLRFQLPPYRPQWVTAALDSAVGELIDYLVAHGRYSEAFLLDEEMRLDSLSLMVQRDPSLFSLSPEHAGLHEDVSRLMQETAALSQRAVNILEAGRDLTNLPRISALLHKKRGVLYSRLAQVREVAPFEAEKVLPGPVTLPRLQEKLPPDQAILKVVAGKEWLAVYLLQGDKVSISRRQVAIEEFSRRLERVRQLVSIARPGFEELFEQDPDRLWLNSLLLEPFASRLEHIRHVTLLSQLPLPLQFLGEDRWFQNTHTVSMLSSGWEYYWFSVFPATSFSEEIEFAPVTAFAGRAMQLKAEDPGRQLFLTWQPLAGNEQDETRVLLAMALQGGRQASAVLSDMQGNHAPDEGPWPFLLPYAPR